MRLLFILSCFFFSSLLFSKDLHVNKIKFTGLKYFSPEFILNKIELDSKVNGVKFFDKLVELELFDRIEIELENNQLTINVEEKPFIKTVKIYGEPDDLHIKSLLIDFRIRSGELYDDALLRLLKTRIDDYYASDGFYGCKININAKFDKSKNAVDISINVKKGKLLTVKEILITGNNVYDKKMLLSLFATARSNWLSWFTKSDIYFKGKILADLRKVRSLYVKNGYINFQINFVKIYLSKNKKNVLVLLNLFEGDKHIFGNVTLDANCHDEVKPSLQALTHTYITNGKLFSFSKIMKTRKKILAVLHESGLVNSVIDFNVLNTGERSVDVVFTVTVGRKIMVKKINFSGNKRTSDHILRNFLSQFEETWLSFDDISFSKQEIIRHGLASSVKVIFINTGEKDTIDVLYKIKEQSINKFMAGCSYLEGEHFTIHGNVDLLNFLGTGKDFSIGLSKSKDQSDYSFNYLEPKFFNGEFDISYNMYYKTENFDKNILYFDHAADSYGASMSYHGNIGKYEYLNIGVGYDKTNLKLVEERAPTEIRKFISKQGRTYREFYLAMNYIYNSLDRPIFPNNGFSKHLNFRMSLPGSTLKYYYATYDVNYYQKLPNKCTFGLYYAIHFGNSYSNTVFFPFFKNFFLRGNTNIRGFRDRSIGPKDSHNDNYGGNLLVCAKLMMYIPTPILEKFETLRTSLFIDIGQVYNTSRYLKKLRSKHKFSKYNEFLRFSVGFGVAWHSPFGVPIDMAIAYPLNPDITDKKKILSFSVGM